MKFVSIRPRKWFPHQELKVKPHLRGWQHAVAVPLALATAIVLTALAPTSATRWASAVYLVTSLLLFGISAIYHRFYWEPSWEKFWRRLDHANIFLLIAGTYTPICVALLEPAASRFILSLVWIASLLGVVFSVFWPHAPRVLISTLYVALGWVGIWYLPQLWAASGAPVVVLVATGGLLYTIGAVVYALKRPNPSPKWFGFHEIFHTFTILAWVCQCIAVFFAVLSVPVP